MKKFLFLFLISFVVISVKAAQPFISFTQEANNQLRLTQQTDTIKYAVSDWEGVKIAVRNLRNDLRAFTGSECAPIIIATVGKSEIANNYKKYGSVAGGGYIWHTKVVLYPEAEPYESIAIDFRQEKAPS